MQQGCQRGEAAHRRPSVTCRAWRFRLSRALTRPSVGRRTQSLPYFVFHPCPRARPRRRGAHPPVPCVARPSRCGRHRASPSVPRPAFHFPSLSSPGSSSRVQGREGEAGGPRRALSGPGLPLAAAPGQHARLSPCPPPPGRQHFCYAAVTQAWLMETHPAARERRSGDSGGGNCPSNPVHGGPNLCGTRDQGSYENLVPHDLSWS